MKYYFPLAKYNTPTQLTLDMESHGIVRYVYGIMFNNTVIKYGQGRHDRVGRQIEGFQGWNYFYEGWSAKEFRKRLLEAGLYESIHRDSIVITVSDYTAQTNAIINKYGREGHKYANGFITNRERESILAESTIPQLNKVIPPKCLEAPLLKESLWEFV